MFYISCHFKFFSPPLVLQEFRPTDESDEIVQTEAEACAKAIVVSGGGKEGIFVEQVMKDTPESKVPSMREGAYFVSFVCKINYFTVTNNLTFSQSAFL